MGKTYSLETLDSLIEFNKDFAVRTFKEQGGLQPMVVGYTPDNTKQIALLGEFSNPEEKNRWLNIIVCVFAYYGIDKYVVMHEGWAVLAKDTPETHKGNLSSHPDRVETLCVIAVNKLGAKMDVSIIKEDRSLEPMEGASGASVGGTFTELLTDKKLNAEERSKLRGLLVLLKESNMLQEIDLDKTPDGVTIH